MDRFAAVRPRVSIGQKQAAPRSRVACDIVKATSVTLAAAS